MSDQVDPQDGAEALDEDVVEPLGEYPPDAPLGVEERQVPESFAERDQRYEPLDEERIETTDAELAEDAAIADIEPLLEPDDDPPTAPV